MNSQDIIRLSREAKSETEAFINRYIDDRAKGWPKSFLCGSTCSGYRPEQRIERCIAVDTLSVK